MSHDQVRAQLRVAVNAAVSIGSRRRRRQGIQELQCASVEYAALLVMPQVDRVAELAAAEAAEQALINACLPYLMQFDPETNIGTDVVAPFDDPLFPVWNAGALFALGRVASKLGVGIDIEPGDGVAITDSEDLIEALVRSILSQALARQKAQ